MQYVKLGELCEGKIDKLSRKEDGQINYIDIASVDNKEKRIISYQTIEIENAPSRAQQLLKRNDILVSTVRPNLNAVAVCDIESDNILVGSSGYCILRCNENVDYRYIFNFCKSNYFVDGLVKVATGASYPAVSNKDVREMLIPLFEIDMQRKIANALDKAQELIDKRKEQIAACNDLIKSQFVEVFGDTVKNEKSWEIRQLQEIGDWKSGGTPSRSNHDYFKGDIDWYSAGELNHLYLEESIEKITTQAIEESSAKLFNKGSMLVGMYDTAAFKMGILKNDSASNQACANVMPNENVNIVWLYYNLMHMKEYFLSNRRGIRQKNLNLAMIREFQIPVPPIELQNQFAQFVQQVDKLKFNMEQSLIELENNFNALMQRAFKGELF